MINVVLLNDHKLLRSLTKSLLETTDAVRVLGDASNWQQGSLLIQQCKPDVIVLDISLARQNGLALIPLIRLISPQSSIIIYSLNDEDVYVRHALARGASAFISKRATSAELITTVLSVSG